MKALPSGWSLVPLDHLRAPGDYTFVGGPFGSDLTTADYISEPGVPVIRGTNLGGKESRFIDNGFVYVTERKAASLRRNTAFPGDIVFTQRGTLGQVALIPTPARFERYVISQSQMKLTPDASRIDSRFLYYFFRAPKTLDRLLSETQATGVPHINLGILKRFPVMLPPLAEQRRIAEVLDRAEALRAKRRAALAQLDSLTQSLFLDLFGDPVSNPKKWNTKPLTDACYCYSGGTPSKSDPSFWNGELPWFSPKDLKQPDLFDSYDHVSVNVPDTTTIKLLPADTVAIVVRGMILAHSFPVSVLRVAATVNQDLKALLPNLPLDPQFLAACLRAETAHVLQQVSEAAHGTKRLDADALRKIPVLLPPIEQQREFARRVTAVEKLKAAQRASLSKLDALFASLQHRAFRGEL